MRRYNKITIADDIIDKILFITEHTSTTYSECMSMNIDELYFLYRRLYISKLMQSKEDREAYMTYEIERLGGISALYDDTINSEIAKQFN